MDEVQIHVKDGRLTLLLADDVGVPYFLK